MRNSILAILAVMGLAAAFPPHARAARTEWVHIIGGKLSNSGPPFYFAPPRANVLITNLPAGWSAGASQCHTLTHNAARKVHFDFNDGLTTGDQLVAQGFSQYSVFQDTYITLCRDASGKPAAFTVQLSYYKMSGNMLESYVVYAANNGSGGGNSSIGRGSTNFEHATTAAASSRAVNTLLVSP